MTIAEAMQYMTTAAWLKGYAQSLDVKIHSSLVHKLNQASELLEAVWEDYKDSSLNMDGTEGKQT